MESSEQDLIPRIAIRDDDDWKTVHAALCFYLFSNCETAADLHARNRHNEERGYLDSAQKAIDVLNVLDPDSNNPHSQVAILASQFILASTH